MAEFAGSQVIAGAVVEIGTNLDKLRADMAQGMRIVSSAEKQMVIKPRFDFQEQQIRDRMASIINGMRQQAAAAKIEIAAQVRLFGPDGQPIAGGKIGNLGIGTGGGLEFKGRAGGGGALGAIQNQNHNEWVADEREFRKFALRTRREDLATSLREERAARTKRFAAANSAGDAEGRAALAEERMRTQRISEEYGDEEAVGGSGSSARSGGRRSGQFNPFSRRGLSRALGSVGTVIAVTEGLRLANAFATAGRLRSAGDSYGASMTTIDAIEAVPLLGGAASGLVNLVTGGGVDRFKASAQARDQIRSQRYQFMVMGKTGSELAWIEGQGKIAEMEHSYLGRETRESRTAVENERQLLSGRVMLMQGEEGERRGAMSLSTQGLLLSGRSIGYAIGGHDQWAYEAARAGQRLDLQGQGKAALAGVTNADDRAEIEKQNIAKLAVFDLQTQQETAEHKKSIASQTAQSIAQTQVGILQASKQFYAADLAAFDATNKAKLDSIHDVDQREAEEKQQSIRRLTLIVSQLNDLDQFTAGQRSTAGVSRLRAGHRNQAASLKAFDDETLATLLAMDPAKQMEYGSSRQSQRLDLLRSQAEENMLLGSRLSTRQKVAGADANGMSRLAGILGTLESQHEERVGADPKDRMQIAQTQRIELQSMLANLQRPERITQTFDPTREALGGSGRRKDEYDQVTRALAEAITELTKYLKNQDQTNVN